MRIALLVALSVPLAPLGAETVALAGDWRTAVESTLEPEAADRADHGVAAAAAAWSAAAFDDAAWPVAALPGAREGGSAFATADGAIWFRCAIRVPEALAGLAASLELGVIDDFDIAWVNGREVGRTGRETPEWWRAQRRYPIPAGILHAGDNAIAVRVFDAYGSGGFFGDAGQRRVVVAGRPPLPLPPVWRHRVESLEPAAKVVADGLVDPGIAVHAADWSAEALARTEGWQACSPGDVDGYAPVVDGAFWYRRGITVAPAAAGRDWVVNLGKVAGMPTVWWDGQALANPDPTVPSQWRVPAAVATAGEHRLAVRIFDAAGSSGLVGSATTMIAGERAEVAAIRLRGPYLQSPSPTTMTVRWRGTLPAVGSVVATPVAGGQPVVAAEPAATAEHEVRITGLASGSDYRYALRVDSTPIPGGPWTFRTLPPAGTAAPLRIWVIGDSGTGNANARKVYEAYRRVTGEHRTDLWLMLGDNAYNNGTDVEYDRAVFAMYPEMLATVPLFATIGNHDGHTADSATQSGPYYEGFTLPKGGECGGMPSGTEAYYAFDIGDIHVVCLDSYETPRAVDGSMHRWLEQDLAQTRQPWLIAFWHHPPYTRGSHDSDRERDLTEMRENFLPLLERHGVDLVLTGHSHSYERSFAIDGHYGTSNTFDPAKHVRIPGDGDAMPYAKAGGLSAHGGTVHIVAGSSGKISGGPLDHPAMVRSLNQLGSAVLERTGDQLAVSFIDETGTTRDRFTIVKGR
jgi:hypothetical protein